MCKQIFSSIIILCAAAAAFAQSPLVDLTFNGTGRQVINFTFNTDTVSDVLFQADGKIILAGTANKDHFNQSSTTYFSLARLNTDGTLDTTFGTNGKVSVDVDSLAHQDIVYSAAIQPDDKIVMTGFVQITIGSALRAVVMRFNADGSVDNTFGTNGRVVLPFGSNSDEGHAVTIAPSGEIVIAGTYWNGNSAQTAVARLSATGTVLATMTNVQVTGNGGTNGPNAVRVQADGKIVTGGYIRTGGGQNAYNIKLVRFNTDGTQDTGFGAGGIVWENAGINEVIKDIGIMPDGRIVASGTRGNDFLVMRFLSNGQLDPSFGTNGRTVTTFNSSYAVPERMVVRPNGKIVLAGRSVNEIAVAYYNADGTPDQAFSGDGKLAFNFPTGSAVYPSAVAIDGSGRIVLGGASSEGTGGNAAFAAARLKTLDAAPVTITGRAMTPGGIPMRNLLIALINESGITGYAYTSAMGYYQFNNVAALNSYVVEGLSKKHDIPPVNVWVEQSSLTDVDIIATPNGEFAPGGKGATRVETVVKPAAKGGKR